jgi:hypothetical protein
MGRPFFQAARAHSALMEQNYQDPSIVKNFQV